MLRYPEHYVQVCLVKPDSDIPEFTIHRTLSVGALPIVVFDHYIPDIPVFRYAIHRTIPMTFPIYRVQERFFGGTAHKDSNARTPENEACIELLKGLRLHACKDFSVHVIIVVLYYINCFFELFLAVSMSY